MARLPQAITEGKQPQIQRRSKMLWTLFAVLLILWLVGWQTAFVGSLIHILLVVALVVLILQLVSGRRHPVV
jgi:hypothetical protein